MKQCLNCRTRTPNENNNCWKCSSSKLTLIPDGNNSKMGWKKIKEMETKYISEEV